MLDHDTGSPGLQLPLLLHQRFSLKEVLLIELEGSNIGTHLLKTLLCTVQKVLAVC